MVLLLVQALQVAHLAFATDIGWSWPSLWVSWLHAVSYGVSFDRYVPNLYSWEWSAAVAIASSLVLVALVLCGFKLRDQHRKGEFVQQQDWIANNSIFPLTTAIATLVRDWCDVDYVLPCQAHRSALIHIRRSALSSFCLCWVYALVR